MYVLHTVHCTAVHCCMLHCVRPSDELEIVPQSSSLLFIPSHRLFTVSEGTYMYMYMYMYILYTCVYMCILYACVYMCILYTCVYMCISVLHDVWSLTHIFIIHVHFLSTCVHCMCIHPCSVSRACASV